MFRIGDAHRKWWILITMGLSGGLILLDETVVGVALPSLQRDLGMSEVGTHWVVNAYMLVFAGFVGAAGRIGDIVGLRTLFVAGMAAFGLGSLASGFAQSGTWLIAARGFQGLGAAAMLPISLAMITTVFPKEQRGKAIGIYAALGTGFLMAGPLVGGFLTEIVSWRVIFWINVPIAIAAPLIVLAIRDDARKDDARPRIDYIGLVALVVGLGLLIFAIMQGGAWGWTDPVIPASFVVGLGLLAAFVVIERRRPAPLIDVDLFRSATFSACILAIVSAQFSKMAVIVFGALYLQRVLGMSPLTSGLALLVAVAGTPFLAAQAGRLADKFGARRPALYGLALATLGILWIGVAAGWDSYALLVPGLVVWGAALPFCFLPPARAIMNAVSVEKQGQAGGINMVARQFGATVGMAVSSMLFTTSGLYQVVFLTAGGLLLAATVLGWLAIERHGAEKPA